MSDYLTKIKKFLLLVGDIIILYLALWLTLLIRYGAVFNDSVWSLHWPPFTLIYFIWLVVLYISGLYDLNLARNNVTFYSTLFKILAINAAIAIALFYFIPHFLITPKTNLFINLVIFTILFSLWRQSYNLFLKSSTLLNNVLIIGENKQSKQLAKEINHNPQFGYRVVGIISDQNGLNLKEKILKENIKTIISALNPHEHPDLVKNMYQCLFLKASFYDLPTFYERLTGKVPVSTIGQIWFLENLRESEKNLYELFKRLMDIIMALIIGIISLPFWPFIILAIKLDSPGPIFFTQARVGKDSKVFKAIKFRSMVKEAEKGGPQWAKINDSRVTPVGRFLRKTRIDEIPQLINVIKGEMSFIGPRPERPEFIKELQEKIPFYKERLLIKPGLSGWAQINFPYGSSTKDALEKLQYDLYYIKNRSLILDLGIILKTINIILRREGR